MSNLREILDEVGMTMFEFVVGSIVALTAASVIVFACWAFASGISQAAGARVSECFYATTFRHDGHLFVRAAAGGLLHHTDCECGKNRP